jgi:CheY-like chemotaxis protein
VANPHILVVDDDTWILRMVTTVLEKRGYSVQTAQDGDEALAAAGVRTPDLIISDVMMPRMDGWAFVRALRARTEFAFTPVIFLTALGSDEDRIRGFKLGADDYLPKPFRFEELDLRIAKLLRRRPDIEQEVRSKAGAETKDETPAGIHGTLDSVGLASLLTILEMDRKTGVLEIAAPANTGRIYIRKGRIVKAVIEDQPEPRNAEAVYFCLGWTNGRFRFSTSDVDIKDEVNASTTHLLMEGARRLDEFGSA